MRLAVCTSRGVAAIVALVLAATGCPDTLPANRAIVYPCKADRDCYYGQTCRAGLCMAVDQDAGLVADGHRADAGRDAATDAALDGTRPEAATDRAAADAIADRGDRDAGGGDRRLADRRLADRRPDTAAPDVRFDAATADTATADAAARDAVVADAGGCNLGALAFDGVDDHVQRVDQDEFDGMTSLTVEAWIRPDALDREMHLVSHHDAINQRGFALTIESSALLFKFYAGGSEYRAPASPGSGLLLTAGSWYHVAGSYDGSRVRTFVNGVRASTRDVGAYTVSDFVGPLRIGQAASVDDYHFDGLIDEVRVTRSALYTSSFDPPTAPLTASGDTALLYRLDQRTPDQHAIDESSHAYSGTLGSNSSADAADPIWVAAPCHAARTLGESACGDRFGTASNYEYCGSTATACWFYIYYGNDRSCDTMCAEHGSSCLGSFNQGSNNCNPAERYVCSDPHGSQICLCQGL